MVKSGDYLWNAGMFVMSTATLRRELESIVHLCGARLRLAREAARAHPHIARLPSTPSIARSSEKSSRILGNKAAFKWHDVGSWEGLWKALGGRESSILRGNVIALESNRVVAQSHKRLLALFGIDDIVAIDTGDAALGTHRSRSQDLRRVSEELARRGLHRHL